MKTKYEIGNKVKITAGDLQFADAILMVLAEFAKTGDLHPEEAARTFTREAIKALNALTWLPGDLKAAKKDLESAANFLGVSF